MTTQAFLDQKPLLLSIAYRMLGSYTEAEDLVQETCISWNQSAGKEIRSARAYLVTIVTRLCLDRLKSAAFRREEYPGTWLPEPVLTADLLDPAGRFEHAETVSQAFLLMLDRLTPSERAAFVLHDLFDFDYTEIALVLEKSEESVRQLNSRARKHVREEKPRASVPLKRKEELLAGFMDAVARGRLEQIVGLLAEDARLFTDSGGRVQAAARNILYGQDHISRFFAGIRSKQPRGIAVRIENINGSPGLVLYAGRTIYSVLAFEFGESGIESIYNTMNPDKFSGMRRLGRPGLGRRIQIWCGMLRHLRKKNSAPV